MNAMSFTMRMGINTSMFFIFTLTRLKVCYKINIYDPLPEFVIWQDDIPLGLVKALKSLGKVAMKRVIMNAVRRLYESVNSKYYHTNGIHGKVKWGFDSK
jgi:hypothetical protein